MSDIEKAARDFDTNELFNVVQFFKSGGHEYVRRNVPGKEAVDAAWHYTHSVGATAGFTCRVIITDSGDSTVYEWIFGKGTVFPAIEATPQKDYRK